MYLDSVGQAENSFIPIQDIMPVPSILNQIQPDGFNRNFTDSMTGIIKAALPVPYMDVQHMREFLLSRAKRDIGLALERTITASNQPDDYSEFLRSLPSYLAMLNSAKARNFLRK